ncbi:hypothetical protein HHK36_004008 [Tetracentron sinense]|uniref:PPM-type phosphatase domain-containing protein n=1 Tax=Tetracentron sinense TaxID=13715 RepID=A0A834ZZK7_TETSI|nr:hypothetical protein HHK36_004008 [Tetracentron sinense]
MSDQGRRPPTSAEELARRCKISGGLAGDPKYHFDYQFNERPSIRHSNHTRNIIKVGDVPRVNGQLAVSRAFGDKSLKPHLRSDPDIRNADINLDIDLLILASDGLWKVMDNQEAVDIARKTKDPQRAAKRLTDEALNRESKDDISCIVVRFRG